MFPRRNLPAARNLDARTDKSQLALVADDAGVFTHRDTLVQHGVAHDSPTLEPHVFQ